ncbi:MAG: MoaD/ThiS family protein [Terracidiphilus sp.]|jgi:molybdopterin synthase sulfur carrier subunit
MQINILTFAQTRIELGFSERTVEVSAAETPREILRRVLPGFAPDRSIRVAVNREYADWDKPVGEAFELALIPPVSGG